MLGCISHAFVVSQINACRCLTDGKFLRAWTGASIPEQSGPVVVAPPEGSFGSDRFMNVSSSSSNDVFLATSSLLNWNAFGLAPMEPNEYFHGNRGPLAVCALTDLGLERLLVEVCLEVVAPRDDHRSLAHSPRNVLETPTKMEMRGAKLLRHKAASLV